MYGVTVAPNFRSSTELTSIGSPMLPRPPGKLVGSELAAPHAVVTCFKIVGRKVDVWSIALVHKIDPERSM